MILFKNYSTDVSNHTECSLWILLETYCLGLIYILPYDTLGTHITRFPCLFTNMIFIFDKLVSIRIRDEDICKALQTSIFNMTEGSFVYLQSPSSTSHFSLNEELSFPYALILKIV